MCDFINMIIYISTRNITDRQMGGATYKQPLLS
jgi:hypothetical protein